MHFIFKTNTTMRISCLINLNKSVICAFSALVFLSCCKTVWTKCTPEQWECDSGQCINEAKRCDGLVHCVDGTDEIAEYCIQKSCDRTEFRCTYGACIAAVKKCNDLKECADGSDEMPFLCEPKQTIRELEEQLKGNCSSDNALQCKTGDCIDVEYKCDGRIDCIDGSDETLELCSTAYCPRFGFRCAYGGCININSKCDGILDCPDGSDEAAELCKKPRIKGKHRGSTITTTNSTSGKFCQIPLYQTNFIITDLTNNVFAPGSYVGPNTIIELKCDVQFILEGAMNNFCNNGQWENEMPNCTTPDKPGKMTIWFRNETTFLVLWEPPKFRGTFTHYRVSIEPPDAIKSVHQIEKRPFSADPEQAAFSGLVPGRAYNVTVQTMLGDKLSLPTIGQYRTLPLKPLNLTFDKDFITSTSFRVLWTAPHGLTEFDKYQITVLELHRELTVQRTNETSASVDFTNIELEAGKTFNVVVKTVSGTVKSWPASDDVTLRPLPVRHLRSFNHNETNAVILTWEPDPASMQDEYRISYTDLTTLNGHNTSSSKTTTKPQLMLENLLFAHNYSLSVQAISKTIASNETTIYISTSKAIIQGAKCKLPIKLEHLIATDLKDNIIAMGSWVESNSIIKFKCESHFTMEGESQNFCDDGLWGMEMPICTKYCPESHLTAKISSRAVCYYKENQVPCNNQIRPETQALLSCNTGFIAPPEHLGIIKHKYLNCQRDGTWDYEPYSCNMECGRVAPKTQEYSIGGNVVNITEVPWHVGVYDILNGVSYKHNCGGTIITPNLVISAAHCFWDNSKQAPYNVTFFRVVAGKYFRDYDANDEYFPVQKRNVSEIHIPSSFKGFADSYEDDIAVLQLITNFKFTPSIRPVCLEFYERSAKEIENNLRGNFAGWGISANYQPSELLQSVSMETLSYRECAKKLRTLYRNYVLPTDKFCLFDEYGSTACRGDSGGGYVIRNTDANGKDYFRLVGVVSHGAASGDCAQNGLVVMTNVQYFEKLIRQLKIASQRQF